MDNIVSINQTKENILKFNLSVEGINPSDIVAKFVVKAENMELGFLCGRLTGDEWEVKLPVLPVLERTAYPFHFELVADGYYFEPLRGTLNVVGSNEVYISAPKNPKIASVTKSEEKKEEKKETKESVAPVIADLPKTKGREKGIEQVARELMEANKAKQAEAKVEEVPAPAPVVVPEPVVVVEAAVVEVVPPTPILPTMTIEKKEEKKVASGDEAALRVLEEMGIRKKPTKPKARFSLK